ncbi:MAG: hypothetical protein MUD12_09755 [Spirochaetes bacterium]|jgi:hypothetical protein|nr:hypothetical protein [Spirochaetota bacterium]
MKKALLFLIIAAAGCSIPAANKKTSQQKFKAPSGFNFRLAVSDTGITNPADDRRTYYRVYIDKSEEGRTTTGLESQEKTFEASLQSNRHLVMIEKWVLDEKTSSYTKLNNVEQPRPNFYYFDAEPEKILILKIKVGKDRRAVYSVDFERE